MTTRVKIESTWCVCGAAEGGPFEPYEDTLKDRDAAEAWLRENHREYPLVVEWYIDREENETCVADAYYDRIGDGSLVESSSTRTPFAD